MNGLGSHGMFVISAVIAFRCLLVFLTLLLIRLGFRWETAQDMREGARGHCTAHLMELGWDGRSVGQGQGKGQRGRDGIVVCLAFFPFSPVGFLLVRFLFDGFAHGHTHPYTHTHTTFIYLPAELVISVCGCLVGRRVKPAGYLEYCVQQGIGEQNSVYTWL